MKQGHVVSPEQDQGCAVAAEFSYLPYLLFIRHCKDYLFVVLSLERMTVLNPPAYRDCIGLLIVLQH
ncbi:MAG: hypothetical protein CMJ66_04330 [Planctomycetaceae bacterium]|nr:hypothetical protein [Planctomycetaceae bacterium]